MRRGEGYHPGSDRVIDDNSTLVWDWHGRSEFPKWWSRTGVGFLREIIDLILEWER
jgi:hypothetical protein